MFWKCLGNKFKKYWVFNNVSACFAFHIVISSFGKGEMCTHIWVFHDRSFRRISVRLSDSSKVTQKKINFVKNFPQWGLNSDNLTEMRQIGLTWKTHLLIPANKSQNSVFLVLFWFLLRDNISKSNRESCISQISLWEIPPCTQAEVKL